MATQRERLIAAGKRQVLLWLSGDVAELLKNLAAADRVTQADLVERALRSYRGYPDRPEAETDTRTILDSGIEARLSALEATVAVLVGRTAPSPATPVMAQKPAAAMPLTKRDKQIAAARRHAMASVTGEHPPIPITLSLAQRRILEIFDSGEIVGKQISAQLAREGLLSKGGKLISGSVITNLLRNHGRVK